MFGLFRALFFGALALLALIPIAILLAVLCAPVLLVLFLIGLPFLIVFAIVAGLLGATFGVLMAFLSVGFVALKIAIVVLVPLLVLAWIARRLFGAREAEYR